MSWTHDTFGNRLTETQGGSPKVTMPTSSSATYNTNNQLATSTLRPNGNPKYDAAGDVNYDGANSYLYDAEGRIASAAGTAYTYDGAGERVAKPGKLYWRGTGSDALAETSATDTNPTRYIFFGGKRIARLDPGATTPKYYVSDNLGSTAVVTDSLGNVLSESEFYPYGGEQQVATGDTNTYKFTGKERDSESGLDYFGARYYASNMGRFQSPDPSRLSIMPNNPQTWNRYTYANNNPLRFKDDNGKWPTEIHNQIIDKAFPNLTAEQRQILKNISASQDGIFNGGQSEGKSFEHAMSSDSQSSSDAFNQFSSFVSTWETEAELSQDIFWLQDPDAASQTQSPEALAAFGMALHAYEDSTSPAHEGFQTWRWYNIPGVIVHHFRENTISDAQMKQAVAIARQAYLTTFGVDIRDAGEGATVTTTQGDGTPCGGSTGNPCSK